MATDLVKNAKDIEIEQLKQQLEEIRSRPVPAETPPQGVSYEKEEKDDRDLIQKELDAAEEIAIQSLFPNGIRVNSFVKTYLNLKGKSEVDVINEALLGFEKAVRPFMSPDGTLVLTGKPSELIRLAAPFISKIGQVIGG